LAAGDEGAVPGDAEAACEIGGGAVEATGDEVAPVIRAHGDDDVGIGGGTGGEMALPVGDGEVPGPAMVAVDVELVDGAQAFGGLGAEASDELGEKFSGR